ncbi:MAG: acetyl-CoA carboxylase biotin carboxyl carrier protein subunit [Vicinamibacteraceae bacterium]|nr:acetyl-CoA carboxylase biotin carboxyl carrier protein subunit [Vicinamibacteraceae bacterium]
MSEHVLRIGGREYRAEVRELTAERATVVVDGTEYSVDLVQLGRRSAPLDSARGARGPGAAAAPGPPAAASVPAPAPRTSPPARGGEGGIVAPMPGLVLSIAAREGDAVAAGQTLLVMEAMKMENALIAPYAGTVSKIYVREGDSIAEGDLLIDVARPGLTAL